MCSTKPGDTLPEEQSIRFHPYSSSLGRFKAVLWAVHELEESTSLLKTIIAPFNLRMATKTNLRLSTEGRPCTGVLERDHNVYFCVPLSKSEHLPLEKEFVRYDFT